MRRYFIVATLAEQDCTIIVISKRTLPSARHAVESRILLKA